MFTKIFCNKILLYLTLFGITLSLLMQLAITPTAGGDSPLYFQCASAMYGDKASECDPSRTPGYPIFILITDTIFQKFHFQLTVMAQYLLILGTAYYVYLLAMLLFQNKIIGYVSYFFIITNPVFLFYSNNILTEITYIFFTTGFCYYTIKYIFKQANVYLILASIYIAISALIRPIAQYFFLYLCVILLFIHYKKLAAFLKNFFLVATIVYIIFLPVLLKNYFQHRQGSLTIVFGYALWLNVYRFNGLPLVDSDFYKKEKELIRSTSADSQYSNATIALQSMGYDLAKTDTILKEISMESIKAHPMRYAKGVLTSFSKMALYPKYIYGDYIAVDQKKYIRDNPFARYAYYAYDDLMHKLNYPSLLITLLGMSGLYINFTSPDTKKKLSSALVAILIFSSIAIASIIASYVRYRIVIDQFLILFSVYAIFHLWGRYKMSQRIKNYFLKL